MFYKLVFVIEFMEFLGHIVSVERIKGDTKKIEAIHNCPRPISPIYKEIHNSPRPTSPIDLGSFLGLAVYIEGSQRGLLHPL